MNKQTTISVLVILALIALVVYMQSTHREIKSETPEVNTSKEETVAQSNPTTTNQNTTTMNPTETTTASGLKITITKEGSGVAAIKGDTVSVNYTGMFSDGKAFDSNTDAKFGHVQPFSFQLGAGMVIKGWDEGVLGMKVGEKRHLVIPASLGYGAAGAGGIIPPNATLEFDVEVTGISHS